MSHRDRAVRATGLAEDCRGQTLQDYALGISVFLIAVLVLLGALFPTVLTPFTDNVGADKRAQAQRVAAEVVTNASVPGKTNHLNASTVETVTGLGEDALRSRYRLPGSVSVNVTLTSLDGSEVVQSAGGVDLSAGPAPVDRQIASSTRIVTLTDGSCQAACRLAVRVW
jgi:type II secretory pathway pseudopilin PulG